MKECKEPKKKDWVRFLSEHKYVRRKIADAIYVISIGVAISIAFFGVLFAFGLFLWTTYPEFREILKTLFG